MRHFIRKFFVLVLVFALGFAFLLCCFVHRSVAQYEPYTFLWDESPLYINYPTSVPIQSSVSPLFSAHDYTSYDSTLQRSLNIIPTVFQTNPQMMSISNTEWIAPSLLTYDLYQRYALHTTGEDWGTSLLLPVPSWTTYNYTTSQNALPMQSFQRKSFTDMIDLSTFRIGPTTHSPAPYTIPSEVGVVSQLLKASSYGKIAQEVESYTPWEWLSNSQSDGYDNPSGMSGLYPGYKYD